MLRTIPTRCRKLLLALLCGSLLGGAVAQTLTVSAASSLTEAMESVADAFEAEHDGVRVRINLASSSTLATQILQGAPVDVFASANEVQMEKVADAGLLAGPAPVFARNRLVVIVAPRSGVREISDLARPGTMLAIAAPQTPIGAYTRQVFAAWGARRGPAFERAVRGNVVSEEPNVRQVAAKVALGQADAALVYATDAAVLDEVRTLAIEDEVNVVARYPVGVLEAAGEPALARAFVGLLLGPVGRERLGELGFMGGD